MKPGAALLLLCAATASSVRAQTPAASSSSAPASPQTLSTNSTLVLVPALVHDKSGQLIYALKASDFVLTDDGVPQKLYLDENSGSQPLALVVDIEGGKSAVRNLKKFEAIGPMLDALVGNVPHRIAVVGFDSAPALVTDFTTDTAAAARGVEALIDDDNGDDRAAILDSLGFSIDLLRKQPPQYRRAILLISETNGDSSKMKLEDAVRAISDTNTTIYSVGFSTGKSGAGAIWSGPVTHAPMPGPDDSFSLMPEVGMIALGLTVAVDGLRRNVPETVAHLTGGEYFQFISEKGLAHDLGTVANHIPNRYVFSFQPQSPHPGFHTIRLSAPGYAVEVSARNGYWAEPSSPPPQP